jgi:hypothetical protein
VCVCVCLHNYEGDNVLYHILWHCFYKVKAIPYLGMCCSENGVVNSTPDVFLGIVVGGRRVFGSCLNFTYGYSCNHESNCFDSWDILQHVLIILSVILSSLISILIPVNCFYTTRVSVTCFLAFFDEKFNFIVGTCTYI